MRAYGHLREVSSKDTRDIVRSEGFVLPIEIFAILSFFRRVISQKDDNIIVERAKASPVAETRIWPEDPSCACCCHLFETSPRSR